MTNKINHDPYSVILDYSDCVTLARAQCVNRAWQIVGKSVKEKHDKNGRTPYYELFQQFVNARGVESHYLPHPYSAKSGICWDRFQFVGRDLLYASSNYDRRYKDYMCRHALYPHRLTERALAYDKAKAFQDLGKLINPEHMVFHDKNSGRTCAYKTISDLSKRVLWRDHKEFGLGQLLHYLPITQTTFLTHSLLYKDDTISRIIAFWELVGKDVHLTQRYPFALQRFEMTGDHFIRSKNWVFVVSDEDYGVIAFNIVTKAFQHLNERVKNCYVNSQQFFLLIEDSKERKLEAFSSDVEDITKANPIWSCAIAQGDEEDKWTTNDPDYPRYKVQREKEIVKQVTETSILLSQSIQLLRKGDVEVDGDYDYRVLDVENGTVRWKQRCQADLSLKHDLVIWTVRVNQCVGKVSWMKHYDSIAYTNIFIASTINPKLPVLQRRMEELHVREIACPSPNEILMAVKEDDSSLFQLINFVRGDAQKEPEEKDHASISIAEEEAALIPQANHGSVNRAVRCLGTLLSGIQSIYRRCKRFN